MYKKKSDKKKYIVYKCCSNSCSIGDDSGWSGWGVDGFSRMVSTGWQSVHVFGFYVQSFYFGFFENLIQNQ